MSFEEPQIRKLRARLNPKNVKTREAEGQMLHYLEGWHVVAEANRIFGFDGWDRETIASDCVWTKQMGQRYCAAYVARVRITVRAGGTRIIREGCGVGDSNAASPGQAHDFAAKAAETDATKRALMTFGNAFGLSLYGGGAVAASASRRHASHHSSPIQSGEEKAKPHAAGTNGAAYRRASAAAQSPERPAAQPVEEVKPGGAPHHANATSDSPPPSNTADVSDIFPGDRNQPGFRAVDKSVLALSEPRRIRNPGHLRFVATKPCLICGRANSDAHHLRFAQPRAMGRKVSDEFTVPLCALHHRDLHARGNEEAWWQERNIEPLSSAAELWVESRGRAGLRSSSEAAALSANQLIEPDGEPPPQTRLQTSDVGS